MIKRILMFLVVGILWTAALAASVADRSPFAQGHWWNPQRSGEGFDIFNAAGQVAVMWFTYDQAGKPVWYTAQGADNSIGTPWPLLKHQWANGHKAGFTNVGTLRLDLNHPESMRVTWQIGTLSGTTDIQPFRVSGVVGESDHTGSWYDPANSGWGVAIVNQGDVLGGAVFTYDANGDPTWLAGFERNPSSVEYFTTVGACPSCPYVSPKYTTAGRLRFDFSGDRQVVLHSALTLPMAAGVNMDGAKLVQLGRPASLRPADRQLANYETEAQLRQYLVAGMLNVPSYGGGVDFSASPPAPVFSSTNLQEAGVDEADVVKSDGRYVYTFGPGSWSGLGPSIRVARVGDDVSSLLMVGSVALAGGANKNMQQAGLYLHGTSLIAITGTQPYAYMSPWASIGQWVRGTTSVEFVDVSAPDRLASKLSIEMDGHLVASRRIGDRLYLVTRFVPNLPGFYYGVTSGTYYEANKQLLASTPLASLLPAYRVNGGAPTPLFSPSNAYAPPPGARPPVADMVVVTAFDLTQMRIAQSLAVLGSADTVYVSPSNLFLAGSPYQLRTYSGALLPEPSFYITDVHQVALGSGQMSIVGSGSVEGYLGNEPDMAVFRLSEFQGKLRVVTSSQLMWGAANKNRLTILEPSTAAPGLLRTISYLPNASRPESLGKPGEMMHATRFVDDRLYAVTFKKIDPLYIVDLVNVSDPRITGTLEMPGFADYLHPLPNGLLLGFGKDTAAPANGGPGDGQFAWYQGLLLSLYDVSNAGSPREVQRVVIGKRGSDSALLRSHHAFSALQRADGGWSVAMPVSVHDGSPYGGFGDPASMYYPWQESGLAQFDIGGSSAANATLVQRRSLITQSAPMGPSGFYDAATTTARSVLFANGAVYVANGQFWRQDRSGQVSGPIPY